MLKDPSVGHLFLAIPMLSLTLVSITEAQTLTWTPYEAIDYVRTYDGVNFSIKLDSTTCPNEKAYFYVKESEVADSKAFAAIAIAAKSSGQLIRIQYELVGIQHCYVTGIELRY